ncbi:MAG: ribosomal protein L32 [Oscillatoriales cyanobacterium]|nr:MAG: ribosomal protein L32 [Oscillatoriales cyanobacterium]
MMSVRHGSVACGPSMCGGSRDVKRTSRAKTRSRRSSWHLTATNFSDTPIVWLPPTLYMASILLVSSSPWIWPMARPRLRLTSPFQALV